MFLCQLILPDLSWKKIGFVVKIFAGRPRDIEDMRTILLKNPDIDVQYIRKWLKEFDLFFEKKIFSRPLRK